MLSSVLKTKIASRTSIDIMRVLVTMRKYISNNLLEQNYINKKVLKHDERIALLESTFSNFDTISKDNYISKELLDVLSKTNKEVTIHTKNIDQNLINKYQSQYNNLKIKTNNSFHDRFIIIDNTILYRCGASFKDLGEKYFATNKIDDINIMKELESKVEK